MNNKLIKVVFILDKSISMHSLATETISSFNSLLKEHKEDKENDILITTVLFNDKYKVLHNNEDIKEIDYITDKDYYVSGFTALNDAVGKTIIDVGKRLKEMEEKERPKKVLFVIITDGAENSSHEFSKTQIKSMVEHQKKKYNWEFIFLGANIDAFHEGAKLGIGVVNNYRATGQGTRTAYETISKCINNTKNDIKNSSADLEDID